MVVKVVKLNRTWRSCLETLALASAITGLLSAYTAPVSACSGHPCSARMTSIDEGAALVGGVVFSSCVFCEGSEPQPLVLEPAGGGDPVEGEWSHYAEYAMYGQTRQAWYWVPTSAPPAGEYQVTMPGACDAQPTGDPPRVEPVTVEVAVMSPKNDGSMPIPAYTLGYQHVMGGTTVPCVWGHGTHCGPREAATRSAIVPHVALAFEGEEPHAGRPVLARLVAETDAGRLTGKWVAPEGLRTPWFEPGQALESEYAFPDDEVDTGIAFPGPQAEYCVAVEMLDLLSGDVSTHAAECLPHAPELPLMEEHPAFKGCDEYQEDMPEQTLIDAFCQDNAADCCATPDLSGCADYGTHCQVGACETAELAARGSECEGDACKAGQPPTAGSEGGCSVGGRTPRSDGTWVPWLLALGLVLRRGWRRSH